MNKSRYVVARVASATACKFVFTFPAKAGTHNDWTTTGNSGTTPGTNFIGTTDNKPFEVRVNNGRALRIQPNPVKGESAGGCSGYVTSSTAVKVKELHDELMRYLHCLDAEILQPGKVGGPAQEPD